MYRDRVLSRLMPRAIDWAEEQSIKICAAGRPLDARERALAESVGVRHTGRIRVLTVDAIPRPSDPLLAGACTRTGFLGPRTLALTLFYGICLRSDFRDARELPARELLAHECRHVAQYERFGSVARFLRVYLPQVLRYGYEDAPLEVDARQAAVRALSRP